MAQVVAGPDGFPCFRLLVPEPYRELETFCVTHALDRCLEQGFGAVVMNADPRPQWVFPYGNLWAFKEHGAFVLPVEESDGEPRGNALVVQVADGSPKRSFAFAPMPDPQRLLWYLPPHLGLMNVAGGWPDPMRL